MGTPNDLDETIMLAKYGHFRRKYAMREPDADSNCERCELFKITGQCTSELVGRSCYSHGHFYYVQTKSVANEFFRRAV